MDKALLTRDLLETFDNINKKDIYSKLRLTLKGEELFLGILAEMGGVSTPGMLIENTEFTPARLSAIIKTLEGKGYIEKNQNELDKRSTIIEITPEGIERNAKTKEEIIRNALLIIEKLGEKDSEELLRLIKKLVIIANDQ